MSKFITALAVGILLLCSPFHCIADVSVNDNCADAEEITQDYSGNGQLFRNKGDEYDYFYFVASHDGSITITQTVSGNINTTLYNADCSSSQASGDSITYSVTSDERYTICLQATKNGKLSYTLDVAFTAVAPIIDHYEIHYDGAALTCEPESITIKACATSDLPCDPADYATSETSITLSPSGWIGGDSKTFTGSADYELHHYTAESVTLAISSANPDASVTCFNTGVSGNCVLPFHEAGFVFDIPTQVACKTSPAVTIKAVKKDDDSQKCVPAFANRTESINFWSSYINPASGTESITVNSTSTSTSSPGTAVSLNFDSDGEAPFTVVYLDAGSLQLDASFSGSGDEAGLEMTGSDTFVVRPAGLCVYSDDANADCASGDATCSKFTQAGQTFNLKVKAVCWEMDNEADTNFCDNTVTANFELPGITISQNLAAPVGGSNGTLAVTSFDMTADDDGEHSIEQSISEVGVFTFTAAPPAYLGLAADAIPTSTSENIGRFYPAEFTVSANNPQFADSCPTGSFTYLGQEFGFVTEPIFTVTALNTSGTTTLNYASDFWKLGGTLEERTYSDQSTTTSSALNRSTDGNATLDNHNDLDGSGTLTVSGDRLTYAKPASSETPFAALVDLDLTATDLTDTDNVCYDSDSDSTCDGYTISVAGTDLYWGRLYIGNNFGPETEDLSLPLTVQYFDGTDFVPHTADSCSLVTLSFTSYSGNLSSGETCVQDSGSPGNSGAGCATAGPAAEQFLEPPLLGGLNLFLKAPGITNNGTVKVTAAEESGAAWLQYDWDNDGSHDNDPTATATFGIYRGNDRIINWQEIAR
ncbi:MAG: DUF6701 domain-containing protein [Thermodesulfobacteriota bacterium]|nr:DUF6701 domain-containing protein [Thermodesulfobacteriota bacterium]